MSKLILNYDTENELDISPYIFQRIEINETPEYVDGANVGASKAGTKIFDRINTRYNFSVPLVPLPQGIFSQIIAACEANEMPVLYEGARGEIETRAQVSLSGWSYALTQGVRIYSGAVITVTGA